MTIPKKFNKLLFLGAIGAVALAFVTFRWLTIALQGKVAQIRVEGVLIDAFYKGYASQSFYTLIVIPLIILGCIGFWAEKSWKYTVPSIVGFGATLVSHLMWFAIIIANFSDGTPNLTLSVFSDFISLWDLSVLTLIGAFILLGGSIVFAKTEIDRGTKDAGTFLLITSIVVFVVYLIGLLELIPFLTGMDGLIWSFGVCIIPSLFIAILVFSQLIHFKILTTS